MPVWHDALLSARKNGKINMLGVIQEQHAERCQLYAQWKQFDWPIVHDPINKLGLTGVPTVVKLDENGIVKSINPGVDAVLGSLPTSEKLRQPTSTKVVKPNLNVLATIARRDATYDSWLVLGDAIILWGDNKQRISDALRAYGKAKNLNPEKAEIHFRLGVAHRMSHDSIKEAPLASPNGLEFTVEPFPLNRSESVSQDNHFQLAVSHWGHALDLNPNQYIYRRRIQQYGPRLAKPYPFYNWIQQARQEIAARGETPIELLVEPNGAEIAEPTKTFSAAIEEKQAPDPKGRIHRDDQNLVSSQVVVVPALVAPGKSVRVHVAFKPQATAHWNNESDPMLFWLEVPEDWESNRQWFESAIPQSVESSEQRSFEFELKTPPSLSEKTKLRAYALFYVREESKGTCLFLRKDVDIPINIYADELDVVD